MQKLAEKKILLVDDAPSVLLFEKLLLMGEGFEIFTANNGEDAIRYTKKYHPDLILLDMEMPDMNGLETCKIIKSTPGISHIPIIFVTISSSERSVHQMMGSGGNDYIFKPINKMEMLDKIYGILLLDSEE